ncbi:hypothetical protein J6590_034802 [Homalodisca vitripennis]|nr:hypothetical protein J6590_034802 [Homalodisca vitripennis]
MKQFTSLHKRRRFRTRYGHERQFITSKNETKGEALSYTMGIRMCNRKDTCGYRSEQWQRRRGMAGGAGRAGRAGRKGSTEIKLIWRGRIRYWIYLKNPLARAEFDSFTLSRTARQIYPSPDSLPTP